MQRSVRLRGTKKKKKKKLKYFVHVSNMGVPPLPEVPVKRLILTTIAPPENQRFSSTKCFMAARHNKEGYY